jgi:branched-chain amino acid transport system substrate-binding protein
LDQINDRRIAVSTTVAALVVVIIIVAGVAAYFAATSLSHTNTTSTTGTASGKKVFNLGLFTELSGQYAQDGQQLAAALQLDVAQVNGGGGVDIGGTNYTLNLIDVDITSDATQAPTVAANALSNDNIQAAIGPDISGMSLAIEPAFESAHVPWIEGGISNSLSALNSTGNGPAYQYFFSTSPNVTTAGNFELTFMNYLNGISPLSRYGIVYEQSEYGTGTANSTNVQLSAAGYKPVLYQSYPTPLTASDAASLATAIKQANLQFLLPISNSISDGETLMQALKAQNVTIDIFGEGPAFGPDLISAIGSAANYVMDNDGYFPDLAPQFASAFLNKTGNIADVSGLSANTEFWTLIQVLQNAKSPSSADILHSFETIDITSGPAYQLLGHIQFSSLSHRDIYGPLFVAQDINGTYHTVYPASFATAKVVWPPPS